MLRLALLAVVSASASVVLLLPAVEQDVPPAVAGPAIAAASPPRIAPARIRPGDVAVLLIDVQPQFVKIMSGNPEPVLARLEQLLLFADIWGIPVLATVEQSRAPSPATIDRLTKAMPAGTKTLTKTRFDATAEPEIAAAIRALGKRQIVVAGCETDVCVLQTVLGLVGSGYEVFLLEDAVFSHEPNVGPALRRMAAAGAVPSTFKTFYFEYETSVAPAEFGAAQRERLRQLRERVLDPYDLPASSPR